MTTMRLRAWWERHLVATMEATLTNADWEELDAAIREDERAKAAREIEALKVYRADDREKTRIDAAKTIAAVIRYEATRIPERKMSNRQTWDAVADFVIRYCVWKSAAQEKVR